jgi:hypothetical protein
MLARNRHADAWRYLRDAMRDGESVVQLTKGTVRLGLIAVRTAFGQ